MRYLVLALVVLAGCGMPAPSKSGRTGQELLSDLRLVLEPDADMDIYAPSNQGLTVRATVEGGGEVRGRRMFGILVYRGGESVLNPSSGAEVTFTPIEGGVQLRAKTVYPAMSFLVEWRTAYIDELGREFLGPPVTRAYHVKD